MSTLSNVTISLDGDVIMGRGQLGLGWRGTATSGDALWTLQRAASLFH